MERLEAAQVVELLVVRVAELEAVVQARSCQARTQTLLDP
jgi:CO/xanthine dehydrogenase Mo-binding subunit